MHERMKISVIIPTYKPGNYIWQCLDSLVSQTLPPDNYELIIVVNGCREPYFSQINEYVSQRGNGVNIQLLQTDQSGVSNARNMGLEAAQGQFVCFIDDDDWVSPTYLEFLSRECETDDTMVIANVKNYQEETGEMMDDWLTACYEKNRNRKAPTLLSCRSYMSVTCCKMVPSKAMVGYRFNTRFRQGEDSLFFTQISHNLHHFRCAKPEAVYYRRIRLQSAARVRSPWNMIADNARLACAFMGIYIKAPLRYSFPFIATRVAACVKGTISNIRRMRKLKAIAADRP